MFSQVYVCVCARVCAKNLHDDDHYPSCVDKQGEERVQTDKRGVSCA